MEGKERRLPSMGLLKINCDNTKKTEVCREKERMSMLFADGNNCQKNDEEEGEEINK